MPGTIGKTMADGIAKHSWSRFVVPFLRTPTNILRYGVKMTPGLSLVQAEYRAMLNGELGREAQAQAIGQMSLGSLFMGIAGYLAGTGSITGGGPSDPKLKANLMATGWRPYSIVVPKADGSRSYVEYGRYDPVAMPLGIIADLVDVVAQSDDEGGLPSMAEDVMTGTFFSIVKQLGNKSYLKSVGDLMKAVLEPDEHGERSAGQMVANLVPASAMLRLVNPDPHMREARDFGDKLLATIPGLSERLPPKRDAFGDPITVHKGLWVDGDMSLVDAEMRRMALEAGVSLTGAPSPRIGSVDLRDLTAANGRNAYDWYQELIAQPSKGVLRLKDRVAKIIAGRAYQNAPDGPADLRGTKAWIVAGPIAQYRSLAMLRLKTDPVVSKALLQGQRDVASHYKARAKPAPQVDRVKEFRDPMEGLGQPMPPQQ